MVSADAGNVAVLGTDSFIFVPSPGGGGTGTDEVTIQTTTPGPGTLEIWIDPNASTGPSTFSHSSLLNLTYDDHPQYLNTDRADSVYQRLDGWLPMTGLLTLAPITPSQPNHAARLADVTAVSNRQIIAGNGLNGTGTLTGNVTLNVGGGAGISVTADNIAVDTVWCDARYVQQSELVVTTAAPSGAPAAGTVWVQY